MIFLKEKCLEIRQWIPRLNLHVQIVDSFEEKSMNV